MLRRLGVFAGTFYSSGSTFSLPRFPYVIVLCFKPFFFRLSEFFFYPLLACLDIGAGVEQLDGCLIVQNRQAV